MTPSGIRYRAQDRASFPIILVGRQGYYYDQELARILMCVAPLLFGRVSAVDV